MTTKDNLTYSQLKIRLYSLSSSTKVEDSALISTYLHRKFKGPSSGSPFTGTLTSSFSPLCTWCKSHGFRHEGHVWQDCRKLRKDKETRKVTKSPTASNKTSPSANKAELALVATNVPAPMPLDNTAITETTNVSTTPIHNGSKFDTAASAHMTSNIGLFEQLSTNHEPRHIRVGGNSLLAIKGKGTIILSCLIPCSPTCFHISYCNLVRLYDVLYVPHLGHSLISWNALKGKFSLSGVGNNMRVFITENNKTAFFVQFISNLLFVKLSQLQPHDSLISEAPSKLTIDRSTHWHAYLGHPAKLTPSAFLES